AFPLLANAVEADPQDIPAWDSLVFAKCIQNQPQEALKVVEAALAKSPGRERILHSAVRLAMQLGQTDAAIAYARRLLEVNPWDPSYHFDFAKLMGSRAGWEKTIRECRAVLRLEPSYVPARLLLISSELAGGHPDRAQKEFELLMAMRPPEPDRL